MSTTATHVRKLESILVSVLRAVFNQNYDSKLSALCLIAGQQRLQSTRLISRIKNFLRITSLPEDRTIRQVIAADEWSAKTYTAGRHTHDLNSLKRAHQFTSVNPKVFAHSMQYYHESKSLSVLKRVVKEFDLVSNRHDLRDSHCTSLLQCFTPTDRHPILRQVGKAYSTLISWMISATDIYSDRCNQSRYEQLPPWCRLCKNATESRQHLLSDCPLTAGLLSAFYEKIRTISPVKLSEVQSLPPTASWLWVLGGGTLRRPPERSNKYRIQPITTSFIRGTNVRNHIDKTDPSQCTDAYFEFKRASPTTRLLHRFYRRFLEQGPCRIRHVNHPPEQDSP